MLTVVMCAVLVSGALASVDAAVEQWLARASALGALDMSDEINPATGDVYCASHPVYELHQRYLYNSTVGGTTCVESKCGDPAVRDATDMRAKTLRMAFTVWNKQMTSVDLDNTISVLKKKMALIGINIDVVDKKFVTDQTYGVCLSAYDGGMEWYQDLMRLKNKHAVHVGKALNVFVGCQVPSANGATLLGIATFPWEQHALTGYGGLWMNAKAMEPDDVTLLHEIGHCLGLWHTFHGVDEIEFCEENSQVCGLKCCERPHALSNATTAASNKVGDMCSDTSAQPKSWHCQSPPGTACNGAKWTEFGPTDYHNIMGYAMVNPITGKPEICQTGFSSQQVSRVHCTLLDLLSGWI